MQTILTSNLLAAITILIFMEIFRFQTIVLQQLPAPQFGEWTVQRFNYESNSRQVTRETSLLFVLY